MSLHQFATLKLKYRGKSDNPPQGKFGIYLGRGDGTIDGQLISGTVEWALFEEQGENTCDAYFVGTITTPNDAIVGFEILGFFKREENSDKWTLSSGIRFSTDDPALRFIDDRLGLIEGQFDMERYEHDYRIFMPDNPAS